MFWGGKILLPYKTYRQRQPWGLTLCEETSLLLPPTTKGKEQGGRRKVGRACQGAGTQLQEGKVLADARGGEDQGCRWRVFVLCN